MPEIPAARCSLQGKDGAGLGRVPSGSACMQPHAGRKLEVCGKTADDAGAYDGEGARSC